MKNLFALLAVVSAQSVFAAPLPGSAVILEAHAYAEKSGNYPGAHVNSPCKEDSAGDMLTVICTGSYKNFAPSEGIVRTNFECVGKFQKAEAEEVYSQIGKIECKDN